jgi:hypothetical protein
MEELILTEPVVVPGTTTSKYRVIVLTLDLEAVLDPTGAPGYIGITLKDNLEVRSTYSYKGDEAISLMKFLNTANLSVKSLHKRILEKLSTDGFLPGTVTGTPDPPTTQRGADAKGKRARHQ